MLLAETIKGSFIRFSQTGLEIFYKPFASFYTEYPFITFQPIQDQIDDSNEAIMALDANDTALEGMISDTADLVLSVSDVAAAAYSLAEDAYSAAAAAQSTADSNATDIEALGANLFPSVYTLSPYCFKDASGGFAAPSFSNTVWLSSFCLMTGLNVKGSVTIPLKGERYRIALLVTKGSSSGNVTLFVDGNNEGELGMYSASNTNAMLEWIVGVSGDGLHTIEFKITSHTSPSSGYNVAASQVIIRID